MAWAAAFLAYLWLTFVRPQVPEPVQPVRRSAGLVYLASVVGMLALIRVGSEVLDAQRGADGLVLRPALIVVAVGLHFLPFASAFHAPVFTRLGLLVGALGVVGLVLGWAWDERAAPAAAVVTGIVMLVVIAGAAAPPRVPREDG